MLLFSAIAPASTAAVVIAARIFALPHISSAVPWSDGAFWSILFCSWGGFLGGITQGAKAAPQVTSPSDPETASA